jgi:hypothetical protein
LLDCDTGGCYAFYASLIGGEQRFVLVKQAGVLAVFIFVLDIA